MYQRGQTLKLSKAGLDWLAGNHEGTRARLATLRFQYRCLSRKNPECITVIKLGTGYRQSYHRSFLEPAKPETLRELGY